MEKIVQFTVSETKQLLKDAIHEELILFEKEKAKGNSEKLFSINQVSKRLGMAHATIKNLVKKGILKSTKDFRISEKSINEYLERK